MIKSGAGRELKVAQLPGRGVFQPKIFIRYPDRQKQISFGSAQFCSRPDLQQKQFR